MSKISHLCMAGCTTTSVLLSDARVSVCVCVYALPESILGLSVHILPSCQKVR